jgi:rRNA pseudouridine-1189 N-methylase Emg1 (Nep1/Mra1 family)
MGEVSTIQLDKDVIKQLKDAREHPRQTYNELIGKMSKVFADVKRRNQYDEFLHKVQQPKMKELWDNKEDEAWENA